MSTRNSPNRLLPRWASSLALYPSIVLAEGRRSCNITCGAFVNFLTNQEAHLMEHTQQQCHVYADVGLKARLSKENTRSAELQSQTQIPALSSMYRSGFAASLLIHLSSGRGLPDFLSPSFPSSRHFERAPKDRLERCGINGSVDRFTVEHDTEKSTNALDQGPTARSKEIGKRRTTCTREIIPIPSLMSERVPESSSSLWCKAISGQCKDGRELESPNAFLPSPEIGESLSVFPLFRVNERMRKKLHWKLGYVQPPLLGMYNAQFDEVISWKQASIISHIASLFSLLHNVDM
ncbi:uncharacterized protein BT62DRAFT_1003293 [Guyanagaster necrorhizus]|uniref:Uncharacterized protein n=1 Tax=Guyanagaster necrorhizus TaxID=856835 RepID=A0A9P8AUT2_9AGAR|nr:uncharacterized protein BT62DRAFT_1003293 [Guyanagaster necrorhizus MCA 3950]KAG7448580.1 hypothetical protein BT62DRAFT_1003293 [Guyanagaster necrorhizus MCA 3950]